LITFPLITIPKLNNVFWQSVLKKPAVQLVEKSEGYRMIPNGDQYILVAPAYQWLSGLP